MRSRVRRQRGFGKPNASRTTPVPTTPPQRLEPNEAHRLPLPSREGCGLSLSFFDKERAEEMRAQHRCVEKHEGVRISTPTCRKTPRPLPRDVAGDESQHDDEKPNDEKPNDESPTTRARPGRQPGRRIELNRRHWAGEGEKRRSRTGNEGEGEGKTRRSGETTTRTSGKIKRNRTSGKVKRSRTSGKARKDRTSRERHEEYGPQQPPISSLIKIYFSCTRYTQGELASP